MSDLFQGAFAPSMFSLSGADHLHRCEYCTLRSWSAPKVRTGNSLLRLRWWRLEWLFFDENIIQPQSDPRCWINNTSLQLRQLAIVSCFAFWEEELQFSSPQATIAETLWFTRRFQAWELKHPCRKCVPGHIWHFVFDVNVLMWFELVQFFFVTNQLISINWRFGRRGNGLKEQSPGAPAAHNQRTAMTRTTRTYADVLLEWIHFGQTLHFVNVTVRVDKTHAE